MTDKLKVTALNYEINNKKTFPTKLAERVDYNKQMGKKLEGQDNKYLHGTIDAAFTNSKEKPSQVYL